MMDEEKTEQKTDGGSADLEGGDEESADVASREKATHVEHVDGPAAIGGGDAADMREAQGVVYKPSGPVHIHIGDRITQALDKFESLLATTKKLGISFYRYIYDRVAESGEIPDLADLIVKRAQQLNLAASWQPI